MPLVGTKEFHDLREAFDKWASSDSAPYVGAELKRENNAPRTFYENGKHDAMFKAWMAGYSLAESLFRNEVTDPEQQVLNPIEQAKLELIKAKIEVEKAKFEQIKKATNPLILPSEAVEAGI